jgi:hypothetical protein
VHWKLFKVKNDGKGREVDSTTKITWLVSSSIFEQLEQMPSFQKLNILDDFQESQ